MMCEECGKEVETRDFRGKRLCYACAQSIGKGSALRMSLIGAERKFGMTEDEIEEEKELNKIINSLPEQLNTLIETKRYEEYLKLIKKLFDERLLEKAFEIQENYPGDSMSSEIITDYFYNEYPNAFNKILDAGIFQIAEELAQYYLLFGEEFYLVPGLRFRLKIELSKFRGNLTEASNYLLQSLNEIHNRESECEEEAFTEIMGEILLIQKKQGNLIDHLKREQQNLPFYEAELKRNKAPLIALKEVLNKITDKEILCLTEKIMLNYDNNTDYILKDARDLLEYIFLILIPKLKKENYAGNLSEGIKYYSNCMPYPVSVYANSLRMSSNIASHHQEYKTIVPKNSVIEQVTILLEWFLEFETNSKDETKQKYCSNHGGIK